MIKVITEPTVLMLARPSLDAAGVKEWASLHDAPAWRSDAAADADAVVEVAGRACYASYAKPRPGGNAAYIDHLISSGHTSVLEHAVWTLGIAGISRPCSHQLVRHRVGMSPSQLSQRFVGLHDAGHVVPPLLLGAVESALAHCKACGSDTAAGCYHSGCWGEVDADTLAGLAWLKAIESSIQCHADLVMDTRAMLDSSIGTTLAKKIENESSRSASAEAAETRLVLTGNARAWRHMLTIRGSEHADAEIRRLAVALARLLTGEAPAIFADVAVVGTGDGIGRVTVGEVV